MIEILGTISRVAERKEVFCSHGLISLEERSRVVQLVTVVTSASLAMVPLYDDRCRKLNSLDDQMTTCIPYNL